MKLFQWGALFSLMLVGSHGIATAAGNPARVLILIGEEAYGTAKTLPAFADSDLRPKKYEVTIIQSDPADKENFPGLVAALRKTDLLIVSARRRTPHREQLDALRAYVESGKPLLGVRTTSHGFMLRPIDKIPAGLADWPRFGPDVLGAEYLGDRRTKNAVISVAPGAASHPVLRGVNVARLVGNGGLYFFGPLAKGAVRLLTGTIPDHPPEPVAWVNSFGEKRARIFYTALGDPLDFENPEFRRLLVNAVEWGLGK